MTRKCNKYTNYLIMKLSLKNNILAKFFLIINPKPLNYMKKKIIKY